MTKYIIIALLVTIGISAQYILREKDSAIEEISEDVIENTLNLPKDSIDFSPADKK
jgi:hypothetical protein